MMITTGCTILRDARGNPGEMIIHKREASPAEADAYCRFIYGVAERLDARIKAREARQQLEEIKAQASAAAEPALEGGKDHERRAYWQAAD